MKIIDAHAHLVQYIAGTGSGGELRFAGNGNAVYANGDTFKILPDEFADGVVTPEAVISLMDAHHVEKALLLQGNYFGFQNLYSYDAVKKYPDRFKMAASYDPFCLKKEQIRKHLFEELKIDIVKFELSTGSGLMSNHGVLKLDGELLENEFSYADEHGLTCVIDIGKCESDSWQIENLVKVIKNHPCMKFVICHLLAASMKQRETLIYGLKKLKFPNVWFDLAALPHNCGPDQYPYENAIEYLRLGIELAGPDRLIFGSDLPSVLKEDSYSHLISFITDSDHLTEHEKELIMYHNAETIYW